MDPAEEDGGTGGKREGVLLLELTSPLSSWSPNLRLYPPFAFVLFCSEDPLLLSFPASSNATRQSSPLVETSLCDGAGSPIVLETFKARKEQNQWFCNFSLPPLDHPVVEA